MPYSLIHKKFNELGCTKRVIQLFHHILRNINLKKVNIVCKRKKENKAFYLKLYQIQRRVSTLTFGEFWSRLYETANCTESANLNFYISPHYMKDGKIKLYYVQWENSSLSWLLFSRNLRTSFYALIHSFHLGWGHGLCCVFLSEQFSEKVQHLLPADFTSGWNGKKKWN